MNLSIHKNKSNTQLLILLSLTVKTSSNNNLIKIKTKSLIRELKTRDLTGPQQEKFNRLFTRFTWI